MTVKLTSWILVLWPSTGQVNHTNYMKHSSYTFLALLTIASGLLFASPVFAASFRFEPRYEGEGRNTLIVDVVAATEAEPVNTFAGEIVIPPVATLKDVRDGNSAINFWLEKPTFSGGGTISFSGIVPGGYRGDRGFLFSLVLEPGAVGSGEVRFTNASMLLNDGAGTRLDVSTEPVRVSVQSSTFTSPEGDSTIPVPDTEIPEDFKPEIGRDPALFDNRWFVAFSTQDKDSGLDRYELQESARSSPTEGGWKVAVSPALLEDQTLRSYIHIKAVDKEGNERVATVFPATPKIWYTKVSTIAVFAALALLLVIILRVRKSSQRFM